MTQLKLFSDALIFKDLAHLYIMCKKERKKIMIIIHENILN